MSKLKEHVVVQGETIQSIAQKELGDASLWSNIAILNALDHPFVADNKQEYAGYNVKIPGDIILLPSSVSEEDTRETLNSNSGDLSLGTDLKLVDGDLSIGLNGDLDLVYGVECLYQDLVNALSIELGTLPYHPQYGSKIPMIVGGKTNRFWIDQAAVEVVRVFKMDPRVSDVKDVSVDLINDAVYLYSTVVTTSSELTIEEEL